MSWPAAGAALTGERLAADFGRETPAARRALAALAKAFRADSRRRDRAASEAALRTYYALVVKLIAARAAGARFPRRSMAELLAAIEQGHVFRAAGIQNFLEGDESWYLAGWNRDLEEALGPLVQRVREYVLPNAPADVFRELYQDLFPAGTRHGRGEYYTPDWLAEKLLASTMGCDLGDPRKRILDPACGSGVFLVRLIHHVRARAERESMPREEARALILGGVAGFDVNPLAVLTARANYLLALGGLLDSRGSAIEIPVYSADVVLAPSDRFHDRDYVVGNPPWVNWESLAEDYRRASLPLWEHYSLFPKRAKAMETILGGAKYDLAMLLTYVAADRYLKHGGKLGFLAPQTLFKSPKAGQGFRRFRLPDGTPIGPCLVEDFAEMRPFRAANRTAAMVLQKGKEPDFPVPYHCFRRNAAGPLIWQARPVSAADPASSWMTAPESTWAVLKKKMMGRSPYRAREGANTGGANGVFWIQSRGAAGGLVKIRNLTERARVPVPSVRASVEHGLAYPLLRGQNVGRWTAEPVDAILLPHQPGMKLRAIPETELAAESPRAFAYLKRFEPSLRRRAAFRRYFKSDAPFYSLFNIGDYTFAPWKVVWREQAWRFTAAVCGPKEGRVVIPDHKLMLVPAASEREAHFLCGALNSLPVAAAAAAYAVSTQIGTHILDLIDVPKFQPGNRVHAGLARWSVVAHGAVRDSARLQRAEERLQKWAALLWNLTAADLSELVAFLQAVGIHRP